MYKVDLQEEVEPPRRSSSPYIRCDSLIQSSPAILSDDTLECIIYALIPWTPYVPIIYFKTNFKQKFNLLSISKIKYQLGNINVYTLNSSQDLTHSLYVIS